MRATVRASSSRFGKQGALKSLASGLDTAGNKAGVAEVEALHAKAVEQHLADVTKSAGGIDISFNMISYKDVQGKELSAMSIEDAPLSAPPRLIINLGHPEFALDAFALDDDIDQHRQ